MATKKVIHKHTAKGKVGGKEKPSPISEAKGKAKGNAGAKDKQGSTSATKGKAKEKSTIKETRRVKRPE
ncbi:hypothetical protein PIB30_114801, partial [Stylosanthes scabra]|nr:hypothetical protein [Stylosanthes scabra]